MKKHNPPLPKNFPLATATSTTLSHQQGLEESSEADNYVRQGDIHTGKGSYDEAIKAYSAAINFNPQLAKAYLKRSQAYSEMGNNYLAGKDCLKALVLNIREPGAKYWLDQLVLADDIIGFFLYDQLMLLKNLLVDEIKSEDMNFTDLAQAILSRTFDLSQLNSFNSQFIHSTGYNLLHIAALTGNVQLVDKLIELGVKANSVSNLSQVCPLYLAVYHNHTSLVALLLDRTLIEKVDVKQAIYYAVDDGYVEIVKLLLTHGADVNEQYEDETTLLHSAAENGHVEVAKLLLTHGAKVNRKDINDITPLHSAAENGHVEVAKLLLTHGAKVNRKDVNDITPFHSAAEHGHVEVAKLLLTHSADVNGKDINDITPLHSAAVHGHVEVVELLLAHGADVNAIATGLKCTALHFAAESQNRCKSEEYARYKEICKLLITYAAIKEVKSTDKQQLLGEFKDFNGKTVFDIASPELKVDLKKLHDIRYLLANKLIMAQEPNTPFIQYNRSIFTKKMKKLADCMIVSEDQQQLSFVKK